MNTLDDAALDRIFRNARTYNDWQKKDVPEALLQQVYELCKWGATSANCSPMRIVFVTSAEAKAQLKPCLDPGNVDKTMSAPVTAIIGMDREFYEQLPALFPHADAKSWFVGDEAKIQDAAFRNGTLQGAYFMIAARALGLDCGPMSGFDVAKTDAAFFANTPVTANFLCNIGYGDPAALFPRGPRLTFDEACEVR